MVFWMKKSDSGQSCHKLISNLSQTEIILKGSGTGVLGGTMKAELLKNLNRLWISDKKYTELYRPIFMNIQTYSRVFITSYQHTIEIHVFFSFIWFHNVEKYPLFCFCKAASQLRSNIVTNDYQNLLTGIETLIPVGLKNHLGKQFAWVLLLDFKLHCSTKVKSK